MNPISDTSCSMILKYNEKGALMLEISAPAFYVIQQIGSSPVRYSCSERPAALQKHMVRMPAVPPTAQPITNPSMMRPPFRFQLQYAQFTVKYAGTGKKLQTGCNLLPQKWFLYIESPCRSCFLGYSVL